MASANFKVRLREKPAVKSLSPLAIRGTCGGSAFLLLRTPESLASSSSFLYTLNMVFFGFILQSPMYNLSLLIKILRAASVFHLLRLFRCCTAITMDLQAPLPTPYWRSILHPLGIKAPLNMVVYVAQILLLWCDLEFQCSGLYNSSYLLPLVLFKEWGIQKGWMTGHGANCLDYIISVSHRERRSTQSTERLINSQPVHTLYTLHCIYFWYHICFRW